MRYEPPQRKWSLGTRLLTASGLTLMVLGFVASTNDRADWAGICVGFGLIFFGAAYWWHATEE